MVPTLIFVFFALYFYRRYLKRKSLPPLNFPGPSPLISLPYLGHGYLLGKDAIRTLRDYNTRYGDVFRLDIGNLRTIFVCGWKLIEEATKSESFSGRPYSDIPAFKVIRKMDSRGNAAGTGTSSGPVWREQRRFMLHHLNDLGISNKDIMEEVVVQEAEHLVQRMMAEMDGRIVRVHRFFLTAINNVIWRILTGKKSRQDDPHLTYLTSRITNFFEALDPGSVNNLVQMYNLRFMDLCRFLGVRNVMDTVRPIYDMLEREVEMTCGDAVESIIDESDKDQDYFYLQRCRTELQKRKDDAASSFHGRDGYLHITGHMFDFFVAGTDTVSTFLEWAILYMCQYPEIQDRLHRDIKDCFGIDGSISLKDTFRLPFLEATVEEIYRHAPETSLLVPHATVCDANIDGKLVPKGTQVFFFSDSIHRDPKLFANPDTFDPERFIDRDTNTFKKSDHVIVFGLGRRKCVGEQLGRSEFFLFLATLLQKFRFSKAREDQILDFSPISGLIFYPKPFDLVIERRR